MIAQCRLDGAGQAAQSEGLGLELGKEALELGKSPHHQAIGLFRLHLVHFPGCRHFPAPGEHLLLQDVGGPRVQPPHPHHAEEGLLVHDVDAPGGDAGMDQGSPDLGKIPERQYLGTTFGGDHPAGLLIRRWGLR